MSSRDDYMRIREQKGEGEKERGGGIKLPTVM